MAVPRQPYNLQLLFAPMDLYDDIDLFYRTYDAQWEVFAGAISGVVVLLVLLLLRKMRFRVKKLRKKQTNRERTLTQLKRKALRDFPDSQDAGAFDASTRPNRRPSNPLGKNSSLSLVVVEGELNRRRDRRLHDKGSSRGGGGGDPLSHLFGHFDSHHSATQRRQQELHRHADNDSDSDSEDEEETEDYRRKLSKRIQYILRQPVTSNTQTPFCRGPLSTPATPSKGKTRRTSSVGEIGRASCRERV
eukprot:TRINITY_DN1644_c0_g1_i2.p1 TRINITY_DN1644_c0_g1~~TRINITY_DN1644_c0_g1_i2.p1  ORF type:complete len:247 (-),score=31.33 TRINITY_DN1644_c0_g1_i2:106-846(-)